jgi:integrase/recombinase XerD
MKKMKMLEQSAITFEEGCNLYLQNCKERNLREGTLGHYRQSYTQFYKYFAPEMPITDLTETEYKKFIVYMREKISNDVSLNSYLKDLNTTLKFLMKEEYLDYYKTQTIKVDKMPVETYTDEELEKLLKKPDIKKCSFSEYQSWVMTNFLFTTGVRQRSLINIKIKDLDFDNDLIHINVTKNRKTLIIPIAPSLKPILVEYLKHRQHKSTDDYLFCTIFGEQFSKSTHYGRLYDYNKARGVETTGIHRYRHTFAKLWVLNGGNVVTLSKILGHSSLDITQNYINLLVTDLGEQMNEIDLISRFSGKQRIKMK